MAYYRQPEFYRNFKCMGGDCPNSCCAYWRIDWRNSEIEKLKNADCSPELKDLIDKSFQSIYGANNTKAIDLTASTKYRCPFLNDDSLCRIQLELGEEYLSDICQSYPRFLSISEDIVTRSCSSSCYKVLDILCNDEKSMNIVNSPLESDSVYTYVKPDTPEILKAHPELKYRNDLFMFFYDIISNKNRSVETSLVLGALAAQKISEFIKIGRYQEIPNIIKALRPQLNATSVPAFEKADINYGISLGLVGQLVDIFESTSVLDHLKEDNKFSARKYDEGRAIFNSYLDSKPHFLRNLALNFLFEDRTPFLDIDRSVFDNFLYYASTIAGAKLVGTSVALHTNASAKSINILVSYYVRGMYHSSLNKRDRILDTLNQNGMNSPAKIALMLK